MIVNDLQERACQVERQLPRQDEVEYSHAYKHTEGTTERKERKTGKGVRVRARSNG